MISEAVSVYNVIGKSLRTKKPVTITKGLRTDAETVDIASGTITPAIDSFLDVNGTIYWVFFNPFSAADPISWYLKHEPGAFDLVPAAPANLVYKGGRFVEPGGSVGLPSLPSFNFAKALPLIIGGAILYKILK
jgi:hypothetical protein